MNTPTLMRSEEEKAPWNDTSESFGKTKILTINILQCLSTTVDIEVPDDFDDYNNSNALYEFVRNQIVLPSELTLEHSKDAWYLDEFWIGI